MHILDRKLLDYLGIELTDNEYRAISDHYTTTLHDRVIEEVLRELTSEQARQLSLLKDSDDDTVQSWLKANVKNLKEIVVDEVNILLGEIAAGSELI